MVEWVERLDYGAESRRKVVSSRLDFAMRRLENSLCPPSSTWVLFFELGKAKAAKGEGWAPPLSALPLIQWDSNPHCPYGC